MYGRNALYGILASRQQQGATKVCFPAYSCGDEVAVAVSLGLGVAYYEVSDLFSIDLISLKLALADSDVIVITHFFGAIDTLLPQIIAMARASNVFVVEDCAYAYFNENAGMNGDAAIFSLRKHWGIEYGGALLADKVNMVGNPLSPSLKALELERKNAEAYSMGSSKLGSGDHLSKGADPFGPRLEALGGYELGFPKEIDLVGSNFRSYEFMKTERESLFRLLRATFVAEGLSNVLRVVDGLNLSVGSYFPLYIDRADRVQANLNNRGYYFGVAIWDRYHPYITWDDHPIVKEMKRNIFAIPLKNTELTPVQMVAAIKEEIYED